MAQKALRRFSSREIHQRVIAHPWVVILITAGITLFFSLQIPKLSFQTSIYDLVIEDLPETAAYERFKGIFGSDEIIRVVAKADNVFDPATFRRIDALAETAARIPGVRRVISLPGIKKAVDLSGKWTLDRFEQVIDPILLFRRNIVSEDHKTTALTLVLDNHADPGVVIGAVEEMIGAETSGISLYQIGMPLVSQALVQLTERDFSRLPPLTTLVIAAFLFLLYRNPHGILMPLLSVNCALVWTFGLMAWSRVPLSMLTMIVPVFLIAVGTAYCLHIVSEYMICSERADSRLDVVTRTYAAISFPTVLAVTTTVIGLGSLLVNRIPMIREFAIFACFGMLSLLLILMTLVPALMCLLPLPRAGRRDAAAGAGWLDRVIRTIVHLNLHRQHITLPIIAVVVIVCVAGIFRIRVETNPMGYFKEEVPVSRHFHDIYRDLSGSFPIHVAMHGSGEDYFENPAHVAGIARLQEFLETLPGVDKTVSFADYLKLVNYASNRFEAAGYVLPTEGWELRMAMNNYKSMLGDDMFKRFMTEDLSCTNILMLTHLSSSNDFLKLRENILAHLRENHTPEERWEVTGFGMVISASSHLLTSGQIKSLSITMILVFGIMFLLFLSGKVGLIAAATNLLPIVTIFGVMGWFGIELSMVTGLIASIAIGLAVDDTIHYLVRYNSEFRQDLNSERAIRKTLAQVGRPIISTTLAISAGFSILLFSGFAPTAVFGIMMVITMFAALVGDMILLPSLMMHVELVTLWDLVRLKMGMEPRQGIPLFQGMSRTQVHYICMAGSLRQLEARQTLFKKGEQSDSMYAVISGEMEVVDHGMAGDPLDYQECRKHLTTLRAGDVVGEMGLLRGAPRSATVFAKTSGELLLINLKMIQRLQWLFPSTARKFFFNLMTILCDRLERVSHHLLASSRVDDLTGLCNRAAFFDVLEKEIHRARRYRSELALCLMRIEERSPEPGACFDVNDPILRLLAEAVSMEHRRCDTLGRVDGTTLALIMPQTSIADAQGLRKRLDRMLSQKPFLEGGEALMLKIGLVALSKNGRETGEQFYLRAAETL